MPGWIGPWELAIVLVIVLLVFGPKRLPGLGKQLGSGMREFKEAITGRDKDDGEDRAPQLAAAQATPEETASAATSEDRERSGS